MVINEIITVKELAAYLKIPEKQPAVLHLGARCRLQNGWPVAI